jgi:hypothetical protein
MSAGHNHLRSTGMSSGEVDKVMATAKIKAEADTPKPLDETYDIPYLAGYSKDGKTIYVDRHLPPQVKIGSRPIDPRPFLKIHESWEKALIDQLGWTYEASHEVASRIEDRAVIAAGLTRQAYNGALRPYIRTDEGERIERVPADLDLAPYQSDPRLVARMKSAMVGPK